MIDAFNNFVGRAYTPVVDSVTGSIASGFAGVDWSYVLSVLWVIIFIYCIFRFLGGVLK